MSNMTNHYINEIYKVQNIIDEMTKLQLKIDDLDLPEIERIKLNDTIEKCTIKELHKVSNNFKSQLKYSIYTDKKGEINNE